MRQPSIFSKIKREFGSHYDDMKFVASRANEALSKSKQAIFALHRDDVSGAQARLKEARTLLNACTKPITRHPDLLTDGQYQAALEEYTEAALFAGYVERGVLDRVSGWDPSAATFLAGLCDATGEIVRFATRSVIRGDRAAAERAFQTVDMTVAFLLDIDLTGYLRTKADQAKKNLRSLEQMMYELSLRK